MMMNGEEPSISAKVISFEDKLTHKNWKTRLDAYEELASKFDDPTQCSKYGMFLKTVLSEANVAAAAQGVAVAQKFVDNAANLNKYSEDITQCIVTKCFTSTKPAVRTASEEVILSLIEAEQTQQVMSVLLQALDGKNPKSTAACISTITAALAAFGPGVVTLKPLLKKLPALFENRDKAVRDEAKMLSVEIYKWIRDDVRPFLESLKPVQVADLQAAFDALHESGDNNKPQPTRYLRSKQSMHRKAGLDEEPDDDVDIVNNAAYSSSALDLVDAVDIIAALPKDLFAKIRSSKWQDRRDALDTLTKAASKAKKLEPKSDYSIVMGYLKTIIQKDSNINVVSQALCALVGLAAGLGYHFPSPSSFAVIVLEKFKEKKSHVLENVRLAADALFSTMPTFDAVVEVVAPFFAHKTPSVKAECLLVMARHIAAHPPARDVSKKTIAALARPVLVCMNDPDPFVRDNAYRTLGHLTKAYGEQSPLTTLAADMDKIKMAKVREYCNQAVIVQLPQSLNQKPPAPVAKPVLANVAGNSRQRELLVNGGNASAVSDGEARTNVTSGAAHVQRKLHVGAESASSHSIANDSRSTRLKSPSRANVTNPVRVNTKVAHNADAPASKQQQVAVATAAHTRRVVGLKPPTARPTAAAAARDSEREEANNADVTLNITTSSHHMPLFVNVKDSKKQRAYDERYVRQFDWCSDTVGAFSTKQLQYLAHKLKPCCSAELHSALFMDDEADWLHAIDILKQQAAIGTPAALAALAENSDLLFKWCGARLRDGMPSPELFIGVLSLLQVLVDALTKQQQNGGGVGRMSEDDAYSIVPVIIRQSTTPMNGEIMNGEQLCTFINSRLCLIFDYAGLFSLLVHVAAAVAGEQPVRSRALTLALMLCNRFGANVCGCVSGREQETLTCMARLALGGEGAGDASSSLHADDVRALATTLCEIFFKALVVGVHGNEAKAAETLNAALHRLKLPERSVLMKGLLENYKKPRSNLTVGDAVNNEINDKNVLDSSATGLHRPATFKILNPLSSLERPLVSPSIPPTRGEVTSKLSVASSRGGGGGGDADENGGNISSATTSELNMVDNNDSDPIAELNDALAHAIDDAKQLNDALKAIHEMAHTQRNWNYFRRNASELIAALAGVMQAVHISFLNDAAKNSNTIQKLVLRTVEVLSLMLNNAPFTLSITYTHASRLIESQLDLLTDDRLKKLVERGDSLVKQLNALVLRTVDAVRIPHILVAGFAMLFQLLSQSAPHEKIDLSLRVIWRAVKNLDSQLAAVSSADGDAGDDVVKRERVIEWPHALTSELFVQLNALLVRFPLSYWATRPDEEQGPLRAVRIIVARLARLKGYRLQQALDELDAEKPRSGELYAFVSKCLDQQPKVSDAK